MIKFTQHLQESLNSSYPIAGVEVDGRSTFYRFHDERGFEYEIELRLYPSRDIVDVAFTRAGRASPQRDTSTATTLKVYATIGSQLRKFLEAHSNVRRIVFDAAHRDMIPVYERLARKIAAQLNGKVVTDPNYTGRITTWAVEF